MNKSLQAQLQEVERKMANLEESFYVNREMSAEIFNRFYSKLQEERIDITSKITSNSAEEISNTKSAIEKALHLSSELATVWASGDLHQKEKLQKLVFPEGIVFNRENGTYRTKRVNEVFLLIKDLAGFSADKKKGQEDENHHLSRLVARTGIEPVIPP